MKAENKTDIHESRDNLHAIIPTSIAVYEKAYKESDWLGLQVL